MAKFFMVVTGMSLDYQENVHIHYNVVTQHAQPDDVMRHYGGEYVLDSALSIDENNELLKTQIVVDAVSKGYKASKGDVIPHGLPVARDAASSVDKTNGITSDRTAVAIDPEPVLEAPKASLMARAMDKLTSMWG